MPEGLVRNADLVRGVGRVMLESAGKVAHALFDSVHSQGLSDYPKHPDVRPTDSDGNVLPEFMEPGEVETYFANGVVASRAKHDH